MKILSQCQAVTALLAKTYERVAGDNSIIPIGKRMPSAYFSV